MLKPIGLDHLALKVTDMEKSLAFYQQVLGLEVLRRSGPSEAGGYAAVLRAGDQMLDLFSRPDFVSADKDTPVGMDHLCLQIDAASIDDVIDVLHQEQVEIFWGLLPGSVAHPYTSMILMGFTWNSVSPHRRRHAS